MHPLDGAREKLRRARGHSAELRDRLEERRRHLPTIVDDNRGAPQREIRVPGALPELPMDLSMIVGDATQNARTALDYAVAELNRSAGGDPRRDRTQFPIATSPERYAEMRDRYTKRLSEVSRNRIDAVQPFAADNPEEDDLAVLAASSNTDKHRALLPRYVALTVPRLEIFFPSGLMQVTDLCVRSTEVEGGADVSIQATSSSETTRMILARFIWRRPRGTRNQP